MISGKISLRGIKRLALELLPSNSHLRELILEEAEEIDLKALPIKLGMWIRLNQIEIRAMMNKPLVTDVQKRSQLKSRRGLRRLA